jgi:DNA repair protein RAD50
MQLIDDTFYIAELKENISQLPDKITRVRNLLKAETRKFDQLNGIKSSHESLQKMKREKASTEETLRKFDEDLSKINEDMEDIDLNIAEPKALFEMITPNVIAEMIKLEELQRAISTKTKEIDAIKLNIPKNIPQMKLSDAVAKRKEIAESIRSKNEKEKNLAKDVSDYKNKLMNTRTELNDLQTKRNQYQEKSRGVDKLKEQVHNYSSEKTNLEAQLAESEKQTDPIRKKLDALIQKKKECRKASDQAIQLRQNNLNKLQVDGNIIKDLNGQIKALEKLDLENKINQASLDVNNGQKEIKLKDEAMETKLNELQEIRDTMNKGEVTLYNMLDNIAYLKAMEELKSLREKYNQLKKSSGDLDQEKIVQEKNRVQREIERIFSERLKLVGSKDTLKNNIEEVEKELKNNPKYKDAKAKYTKSIVQECVLKKTIDDMNQYRVILEKALMRYHKEKMDQINATTRQLWHEVYRGNDIDNIMIKTDEESLTSSDKKRSYNYRVCQQKLGGEYTEMRGRCSAGQKVLASIIIRIALADTFSSKCGVLALDEPTTNLDVINIRSLSRALAKLIQQRNDGHFMLIVITHDESFIASLEQGHNYVRISRNIKGLSHIEEVRP